MSPHSITVTEGLSCCGFFWEKNQTEDSRKAQLTLSYWCWPSQRVCAWLWPLPCPWGPRPLLSWWHSPCLSAQLISARKQKAANETFSFTAKPWRMKRELKQFSPVSVIISRGEVLASSCNFNLCIAYFFHFCPSLLALKPKLGGFRNPVGAILFRKLLRSNVLTEGKKYSTCISLSNLPLLKCWWNLGSCGQTRKKN